MNWEHLEKIFPFHVIDPSVGSLGEEVRLDDFMAISKLLYDKKPKTILEIGAWTGSCTVLFGNYVKEYGGKVHSIDNFNGSPGSAQAKYSKTARRRFFENLKTFGLEDVVVFHEGSSDDFVDLDIKFDFIFIDADHRYSQVKRDIENYYPKVSPGGILAGHDYNSYIHDERYIEYDYVDGIHHGVTKAVMERFPKVLLFTVPAEGDKRRLASSVWHVIKEKAKMPCVVAM